MAASQTTGVSSLRALRILIRVQISSNLAALPGGKRGLASGAAQVLAYVVYALLGVLLSLFLAAMLLFVNPSLIPGVAVVLAAITAAVLTFQNAGGSLFGFTDYDQVMALPVPTWVVVLSRIGALFAVQVVISAVLMLPMYALCAFIGGIGVGQVLTAVLSILLAGALPVSVMVFLSLGIAVFAAHTRNFNVVYLALSILLFVAMLVGSFAIQGAGAADVAAVSAFISGAVALYPPAAWSMAAWTGDVACLLPFCLVSLGAFVACIAVLSRCFMQINAAMGAREQGHAVDIEAAAGKRTDTLHAMVKKELGCIMGTPIYATNSIGGEIFIVIVVAMLLIMGKQGAMGAAVEYLSLDAGVTASAVQLSDIVLAWFFVFCMSASSSACAAVSMEGRSLWLMATAPVPRRTIMGSKVLASVVHAVPVLALAIVILTVTGVLSPVAAVVSLLLGTSLHFFTACMGLMLDVAHPRCNWIKPADAVKRGRPIMVAALVSLVVSFGGGAATIAVVLSAGELAAYGIMLAVAAVFALLAWACFRRAEKTPLFVA